MDALCTRRAVGSVSDYMSEYRDQSAMSSLIDGWAMTRESEGGPMRGYAGGGERGQGTVWPARGLGANVLGVAIQPCTAQKGKWGSG